MGMSEACDAVSVSLAPPVIVGGTGGCAFSTIFNSTIQKISISYDKYDPFMKMKLTFEDGKMINFGKEIGNCQAEFVFEKDDKILSATVWPNDKYTRTAGLEFMVAKGNGERKHYFAKGELLGQPVSLDVKTGNCYGITGRSGAHIDALGFYFF
ncbi:putative verrucotoxin subunit beta-like [Triplophysa rosa]|nr:putative verrucotoxin subunit beta-like [Triplophysa rosa]